MIRTSLIALSTVAAAGAIALTAAPANAAHCAETGAPGHSEFAAHVKASNGPGEHNEGLHQGWSSCR